MSAIDATEEIRPLCEAWYRASQETDDAWFAANVADEFRYLMGDGAVEPRDVIVPMSHQITGKHYEVLDVTGHRYGDVLVGYGTYSARGVIPEGLAAPAQIEKYAHGVEVRFSIVWAPSEHDGVLRCVLMQSTPILA